MHNKISGMSASVKSVSPPAATGVGYPSPNPYSPTARTSPQKSKRTPSVRANHIMMPTVRSPTAVSPTNRGAEMTSPRAVGGQRFLPETPKSSHHGGTPTAVPPIYANVHSQLNSGNSRQMSPQIAKILEDYKTEENGHVNGVSNSGPTPVLPTVSPNPPAVPRPAARMSLRHKVCCEYILYTFDLLACLKSILWELLNCLV